MFDTSVVTVYLSFGVHLSVVFVHLSVKVVHLSVKVVNLSFFLAGKSKKNYLSGLMKLKLIMVFLIYI